MSNSDSRKLGCTVCACVRVSGRGFFVSTFVIGVRCNLGQSC